MVKLFIFIIFLCFGSASLADSPSITGTYSFKEEGDSGCVLKAQKLSGDKLRFELNCERGAPSYNSGLALGKITIKDNVASYVREVSGRCVITFKFKENSVHVTQEGMGVYCGFGMGVYVDGTYLRDKKAKPDFEYKL